MNEKERADFIEQYGQNMMDRFDKSSPLLKTIGLLVLKTHDIGKPDEEGGKNFIHNFLASDILEMIKLPGVSGGAIDAAMMFLNDEFCNIGSMELVFDMENGPAFSLMLDELTHVPMGTDDTISAKDIDWSDEDSILEESRLVTNIPSLKALMYACFYMGAYSANSMKAVESLDEMWNVE